MSTRKGFNLATNKLTLENVEKEAVFNRRIVELEQTIENLTILLDKETEARKTAESKLENLQTKVAAGNKKSAIKKTTTTKRKIA